MEINTSVAHIKQTAKVTNATIELKSGDHLAVAYKDPYTSEYHVLNISAQHLVFLVTHEQTEATMMIRHSGVQYVGPVK
jgi:lipocalin